MPDLTEIDIDYSLYRKAGNGQLAPVTAGGDLELQAALRNSDPDKWVEQVDSKSAQADIVHEHVVAELEAPDGFVIGFDERKDSKFWVDGTWQTYSWGASVTYPVRPADSQGPVELFLAVATSDCE
jgi:hypothetical protein